MSGTILSRSLGKPIECQDLVELGSDHNDSTISQLV